MGANVAYKNLKIYNFVFKKVKYAAFSLKKKKKS